MAGRQETELEILIRARYPLIYLVSWEERRVEAMLGGLAARRGKRLFFWTVTQGMCEPGGSPDNASRDPQAALDFVVKSEQQAVFVLKDFHAFMQDAGVVRRLRDLVQSLKPSHKTLVILSPVLTLPVELEKDVTVVDYDLPGFDEMRDLLKEAVAASQGGAKFPVELKAGEASRLVQASLGMTLSEAENAFAKSIVRNGRLGVEALDVILEEIKQVVRKSRQLEYFEPDCDFGQVGGLEILKDWIRRRGKAFSEEARRFGLPQPRGVLVLGVQGCGKSMTCKTIAGLWKVPLLRLDMGAIFGGIVGQSEENMRRAIKTAESVAPCVLWLDEIEKGLSGTQSSNFSDAGTTARVFSTFLTWLQEKKRPVFVAATANNIQMLPPELLRKGRLDDIFFVDLPGQIERREILSIHVRRKGRDPAKFDLDALSKACEGFSGAEIEQAITSALFDAFYQGREVSCDDVLGAMRSCVPLSRTMREEIDALRSWASTRARPASKSEAAPPKTAGAFDRPVEMS
jgi:ATP-dependent 26S proteasome regulatory subunit